MNKALVSLVAFMTLFCFSVAVYAADQPAPVKHVAEGTPAASQGAAPAAGDAAALARAAQNPLSSMISVPIQLNLNMGVDRYEFDRDAFWGRRLLQEQAPDGSLRLRIRDHLLRNRFPGLVKHERTQEIINIQPVYPVSLGSVNLINRLIVPIMSQPMGRDDTEFGLGDIQYTAFFSPAKAGKVLWGVGPAFMFPTATDDALGAGKWCAGPAAVVLTMPGRWVFGALASNLWSFAGEGDRPDVNSMLLQPFINYNFNHGWYFSMSPMITANWEADNSERWTLPVGGGFGKIFKIGRQPVNASVGAYHNVEHPDSAPDWNLRFQLQFMFPK